MHNPLMQRTIRQYVFDTLDAGRTETPLGKVTDYALMALIALNVVAVIIESIPSIGRAYAIEFSLFETISVGIFTVEYILRVWSAPEHAGERFKAPVLGRIRYMLTPMAIIDLLVILPFYLSFFVGLDLRVLRVVRLLRIARLTRYSSAMTLLFQVLRDEARNIGAALFVLIVLMVLAASAVYVAEHEAQPEVFGTIPQALWWAVITMTTIGYGDVIPITTMGRLFGGIIGIFSVGMVALPAGILASGFNEALHRRRRRFETLIDELLDVGPLDDESRQRLRDLQEQLGLNDSEAASFLAQRHRLHTAESARHCPHCGKPISQS